MRLHNRQIKATFWNDTDLLQWPRDKRWFYEGLIQLADDSGCLEDSPFAFKLNLFPSPVDADITVELLAQWRDELIEDGKLVRYRVGKKDYLYLINFHKHQSLKNPEKPDVPLPPWIRWESFKSNEYAGKYIVSEDVLSDFLVSSENVLPIEIEKNRKELYIATTTNNAHAREEECAEDITDEDETIYSTVYETMTVHEAHMKAFNTTIIQPLIAEFYANLLRNGHDEQFVVELILEAGESSSRPSKRLLERIYQAWTEKGITSRAEAKAAKARDAPPPRTASPPPQRDKYIEARNREIALNRWIDAGGDPDEFVYIPKSATSH